MKRVTAVKLSPEVVNARLSKYETQFGMSSAEFYRRFEDGEFGHGNPDYMRWATLVAYRPERAKAHA